MPERPADPAHHVLAQVPQGGDLSVGEAVPLGRPQQVRGQLGRALDLVGDLGQQHQLVDEPRVDLGRVVHLLGGGAGAQRLHHQLQPAVVGTGGHPEHLVHVGRADRTHPVERGLGVLQAAQRLAQRLGEVAADAHRLADALHVRGEGVLGGRELLEREPRHLDDHVVQRRLEAGRGDLGDVVGDLVQGVTDRHLGRDLGRSGTRSPWRPGRWSGTPAGSSRSRSSGRWPGRWRTGCCSRRCPPRRRG